VVAPHLDGQLLLRLANVEARMVVDTWEEAPAEEGVQARRRVAPWDEDALPRPSVRCVPLDGEPMRHVLRHEAHEARERAWPDLLQADEADATDSPAPVELGPERRGQRPGENLGIDREIHEDAPVDDAPDPRDAHPTTVPCYRPGMPSRCWRVGR